MTDETKLKPCLVCGGKTEMNIYSSMSVRDCTICAAQMINDVSGNTRPAAGYNVPKVILTLMSEGATRTPTPAASRPEDFSCSTCGEHLRDCYCVDRKVQAAPQEGAPEPKMAPVQGYSAGIPWEMHLRAYDVYRKKYGKQQALIEGGCRGGFGDNELDTFIPGWREELSDRAKSDARIAELEAKVVELSWLRESDFRAELSTARNEARDEGIERSAMRLEGLLLPEKAALIRALKTPDTQEVELKPVEPEVVYNLAAMEFEIDSNRISAIRGTFFKWDKTPDGWGYWDKQSDNPTDEGRDKIRAMLEQFGRENA